MIKINTNTQIIILTASALVFAALLLPSSMQAASFTLEVRVIGIDATFNYDFYSSYTCWVNRSTCQPFSGASITTANGEGSAQVDFTPVSGQPSLIVNESQAVGKRESVSCQGGGGNAGVGLYFVQIYNGTTNIGSYGMTSDAVTCTITYRPPSLQIIANSTGGDETFDYYIFPTPSHVSVATENGSGVSDLIYVDGSLEYTIQQVTPGGFAFDYLFCDSTHTPRLDGLVEGVTLSGSAITTCTFNNYKEDTPRQTGIQIVAYTSGQDTSFRYTIYSVGGLVTENPTNFPGVVSNASSVGVIPWDNPSVAVVEDAVTTSIDTTLQTYYLKANDFGFNIPLGAVIDGIEVEWKKKGSDKAKDASVKIVKGGIIQGNEKAQESAWPTNLSYSRYGADNDLWGAAFAPEDINSSGFGAALSARATELGERYEAEVDSVRITVHYTYSDTSESLTREVQTNNGYGKSEIIGVDPKTDYVIRQEEQENYQINSILCNKSSYSEYGNGWPIGLNNVSVFPGEITICIFNIATPQQLANIGVGELIIKTKSEGGDGTFKYSVEGSELGVATQNGEGMAKVSSLRHLEAGISNGIIQKPSDEFELVSFECDQSYTPSENGVTEVNIFLKDTPSNENFSTTCTFKNQKKAGISITKNITGGDSVFYYSIFPTPTLIQLETKNGTGTTGLIPLDPTINYSIAEAVDNDYAWTNNTIACSDGSSASGDTINRVDLSPGQATTCTFTGAKTLSITLPLNDPIENPPSPTGIIIEVLSEGGNSTFTYTAYGALYSYTQSIPTYNGLGIGELIALDPLSPASTGAGAGANLPRPTPSLLAYLGDLRRLAFEPPNPEPDPNPQPTTETFTIIEKVPDGWTFASASCDDGSSYPAGKGVRNITVTRGQITTCTFRNKKNQRVEVSQPAPTTGPSRGGSSGGREQEPIPPRPQ